MPDRIPLRKRRKFEDVQFEGNDLWRADFSDCDIQKANFKSAILDQAIFDRADVQNAVFDEAKLFKSKARYALFGGSSLRKANLQGAALDGTDLSHADLSGADLKFACLSGVRLDGASVQKADLRFSRGLTPLEKTELHRRGAIVCLGGDFVRQKLRPLIRTIWGKILCFLLGLAAGSCLYFFFSSDHFQSIPRLVEKRDLAKSQKQYETAIRLDFALSRKYKIWGGLDASVRQVLDAVQINKSIGRRPRALQLMTSLLNKAGTDELQVCKIKLELAIFFKEEGQGENAGKLLKEIRPDILENDYDASLKLGGLYREMKAYPEAEGVYRKMIETFSDHPGRRAEAAAALHALQKEREHEDFYRSPDRGGAVGGQKIPF